MEAFKIKNSPLPPSLAQHRKLMNQVLSNQLDLSPARSLHGSVRSFHGSGKGYLIEVYKIGLGKYVSDFKD